MKVKLEKILMSYGLNDIRLYNEIIALFNRSMEYQFITHLKQELERVNKKQGSNYKITCPICNKSIDTIYEENGK